MPADRPRRRGTVRFRITATATVVVAAVLLVTGVGLVLTQRRLLTNNLERTVRQRVEDVRAVVLGGEVPRVLGARGEDEIVAQIVSLDGDVLAASPVIGGQPAIAPPPVGGEAWRNVHIRSVEDAEFRVLSRRVGRPNGVVVVHVGGSVDDVSESTRILAASVAVAFPVLTALLALLIWWLVGRTLRPVEAIRTEVAAIGGADLDRRVPAPAGDDEIARLARTMNGMLDRVEDAAVRQQRFVADASHELRSPLTRMRSELEVDLAHPGTADPYATRGSLLEEIAGLQRLVDDLLHLARSDARAAGARRGPVDLDDVVLEDARRLRADGRVAVDTTGVSAARVDGDDAELARAVRNLTDNALRHARAAVTVTLAERDGAAVLTIADDGPGIPAEERERVFERFARLDDARTAGGGVGLGLAITRDIVVRHRGTVVIDPDHGTGTRVIVTLPTAL